MPVVNRRIATQALRPLHGLRDPSAQTELLQSIKAVTAAVAAWIVAAEILNLAQPFLAPWTALLTVHATVYRSMWRGAQSVIATVLGIVVAVTVAEAIGLGSLPLGVALLLAMLLCQVSLLRPERMTATTTALIVLTTGYSDQESVLGQRLLDTIIGVGIGIAVNLILYPPLNDRSAQQRIDRIDEQMGALLSDMSRELRSAWTVEHSEQWIDRTRVMDHELELAWQLVRHAQESVRWNPRQRSRHDRARTDRDYADVLERLEEGIAQTRSMARTIHESTVSAHEWDERFRAPWLDLLAEAGRRVADPDAEVRALRDRVDNLTLDLSREDLPGLLWPVYGALISNLINVLEVVDDVATARPVRT